MPRAQKPAADSTLMSGVAQRIRAVMNARGLNQQQVAAYSSVPEPVLSGLLKGTKDRAAFETIYKIAKGLNMSLDELAGLSPLTMPEPRLGEPSDRLAKLEKTVETLLVALGPALKNTAAALLVESASPQQATDTPQQRRTRTKRPA